MWPSTFTKYFCFFFYLYQIVREWNYNFINIMAGFVKYKRISFVISTVMYSPCSTWPFVKAYSFHQYQYMWLKMEISLNKLFCPRARCSSFLWPSLGSVFGPTFSRFQLLGQPWAHLQNPIHLLHQQRHPNEFNEIFGQHGFLLFSTILNDYKYDTQITCNGELFLWRCQQAGRCPWQPGCAWSRPRTCTVSPCCTGSPEFTQSVMIR